jgi:hypothetical protein
LVPAELVVFVVSRRQHKIRTKLILRLIIKEDKKH